MTMIRIFGCRDLIWRATSPQGTSSSPLSRTTPLTAGNLLKTSRASLPLYAVSTLNLAVSMTSLRVEMLPGNSRSITRKHGLIMLILDAYFRSRDGPDIGFSDGGLGNNCTTYIWRKMSYSIDDHPSRRGPIECGSLKLPLAGLIRLLSWRS